MADIISIRGTDGLKDKFDEVSKDFANKGEAFSKILDAYMKSREYADEEDRKDLDYIQQTCNEIYRLFQKQIDKRKIKIDDKQRESEERIKELQDKLSLKEEELSNTLKREADLLKEKSSFEEWKEILKERNEDLKERNEGLKKQLEKMEQKGF